MIDPDLLKIMCCPETHQPIALAEPSVIERLNQQIAAGQLKNRAGETVKEKIDGGLVREDKKFLYPVRGNIPVMLIDEAIPLAA
ncbi:MAG TPA: hypothetical protein VN887_15125 [Candidatus Angelobacter sp.]|nr:hypothetical protein [Candidatus Angelobacter sp.]